MAVLKSFGYIDHANGVAIAPIVPTQEAMLQLVEWQTEPQNLAFYHHPEHEVPPSRSDFLARMWKNVSSTKGAYFHIFAEGSYEPEGFIRLIDPDGKGSHAFATIMIGQKSKWGRGYGYHSTRLAVYGAKKAGFTNVVASIHRLNYDSLGVCRKFGAREEQDETYADWINFDLDLQYWKPTAYGSFDPRIVPAHSF